MKIEQRQAGRLLEQLRKGPCDYRVLLLHGDDPGLIRERAQLVVAGVLGHAGDDPFRLAILDRTGHERLAEEAGALALTGGRRVVWVREAGDAVLGGVQRALQAGAGTAQAGSQAALVVIEAPDLPSRAKLRTALEAQAQAAVLACYHEEGRALESTLAAAFGEAQVLIDRDALGWLAMRLGSDRAAMRQEIEKLVLYAGPQRERLCLADLEALTGDAADLPLDEATHAAMSGDPGLSDRAVERALAEGATPIVLLRALLGHVHRLRAARAAIDAGASAADAVRGLRPPVFFRRIPAMTRAASLWPAAALDAVAARVWDTESRCKQTGAPDAALVRALFARCAREATRLAQAGRSAGRH